MCSKCHYRRIKKYRETDAGRIKHSARLREYKDRLKAEGIAAYGGGCHCCGESHPAFLTLDHLNDDGGGRRRAEGGRKLWARLRAEGWPVGDIALACFNCNTGRHINGGTCPHEEEQ